MLNIAAFTISYTDPMIPAGPKSSWSSWVKPVPRSELLDAFSDFGVDAQKILGCADENVSKWAAHGLYPALESYVARAPGEDGRVGGKEEGVNSVLVGDAAHAMMPHLGAGAGAGIEDAFVLARLLAHPRTTRENLSVRVFST